jgi:hypothetical protein
MINMLNGVKVFRGVVTDCVNATNHHELLSSFFLFSHVSRKKSSTIKYPPADAVAQPLVVQNEIANLVRELVSLPGAFFPTRLLTFPFLCRGLHSFDRVGCGSEFMGGDVRHRRGLAGCERSLPGGTAQPPGCSLGIPGGCAGLGHFYLTARPCSSQFDRLAGSLVRRLHCLKKVKHVLRTQGCPQSQEPVVGVGEDPATA